MADQPSSGNRARTLALQARSFEFSTTVIEAYPRPRPSEDPSRDLWRQLIRASTSSTFNLEEADAASSRADFIAKMRIALREAKEAHVIIRMIVQCKLANYQRVSELRDEANQLASIFAAIVKNATRNS